MQVTSLFDLRQQLAVYLLPLLGECEILYSMPTVRRPLAAGVTTLVLNDHSVKRSEDTLPGSTPLLLAVGLGVPALMFPVMFKCGATKGRTVYISLW